MWKGIDALSASGKARTIIEMQEYVERLPPTTWASGMVLHNTAAPTMGQWTPDNRAQRILNLEKYFRDDRGWPSGPHAFVDYFNDGIWVFTPFTEKGTHSPSWNGTRLGIEMIGDFSLEDDDTGLGLQVKKNTVALFAMMHTRYGWNPETIKLHKEDPRTTHDCPGKDVDKNEFIELVQEYMGHAGEHSNWPDPSIEIIATPAAVPLLPFKVGTVTVPPGDSLTLRETPSVGSRNMGALPNGTILKTFSEEMNGKTRWLRVETPMGYKGWVAARYIMITGDLP